MAIVLLTRIIVVRSSRNESPGIGGGIIRFSTSTKTKTPLRATSLELGIVECIFHADLSPKNLWWYCWLWYLKNIGPPLRAIQRVRGLSPEYLILCASIIGQFGTSKKPGRRRDTRKSFTDDSQAHVGMFAM